MVLFLKQAHFPLFSLVLLFLLRRSLQNRDNTFLHDSLPHAVQDCYHPLWALWVIAGPLLNLTVDNLLVYGQPVFAKTQAGYFFPYPVQIFFLFFPKPNMFFLFKPVVVW